MGFGNSNNWQTEAALRNERLAKQTSLDKLLEHVNWDAETLTLSLNGITLSWGDITGAGDVAMKSDRPTDAHITQITENTISTMYIVADSVAANHITNATLWGNQYGFSFDTTDGFKVGYMGTDEMARANLLVGYNQDGFYGTVALNAYEVSFDAQYVNIWATKGATINGYEIVTDGSISSFLSSYAKLDTNVTFNKATAILYQSASTTTSTAQCGFSSANCLLKYSESSRRYKHDIHSMTDELKNKICGLYDDEVKNWTYNDDYIDPEDNLYQTETFGLIAEDVAEVLPEATVTVDGIVTNYRDRHIINALLVLIQDLNRRLKELEGTNG